MLIGRSGLNAGELLVTQAPQRYGGIGGVGELFAPLRSMVPVISEMLGFDWLSLPSLLQAAISAHNGKVAH